MFLKGTKFREIDVKNKQLPCKINSSYLSFPLFGPKKFDAQNTKIR
jgi:hypothetical protein